MHKKREPTTKKYVSDTYIILFGFGMMSNSMFQTPYWGPLPPLWVWGVPPPPLWDGGGSHLGCAVDPQHFLMSECDDDRDNA